MGWQKTYERIRNCGGKYPESSYAQNGYRLGPLELRQCPKTFIDRRAKAIVEVYDESQHLGVPIAESYAKVPMAYLEAASLIENQRSVIRAERGAILAKRRSGELKSAWEAKL